MNQEATIINPSLSLQDQFASHNQCFGCGPSNPKGLQIKSFVQPDLADEVVAIWQGQTFHEAFPGILCGGIIGTLLDCHANWTAAYFLMKQANQATPPCTVTAYYNVSLKRPTPSVQPVKLVARLKEIQSEDRALITADLYANDKLCATCEGLFVAVKEGHPAFHRW